MFLMLKLFNKKKHNKIGHHCSNLELLNANLMNFIIAYNSCQYQTKVLRIIFEFYCRTNRVHTVYSVSTTHTHCAYWFLSPFE